MHYARLGPKVRTAPNLCLKCGAKLDGASELGEGPKKQPGEGDLSICIYCGAFAVFQADGSLRKLTPEQEIIARNNPKTQAGLRAVMAAIKERGGYKQTEGNS